MSNASWELALEYIEILSRESCGVPQEVAIFPNRKQNIQPISNLNGHTDVNQ